MARESGARWPLSAQEASELLRKQLGEGVHLKANTGSHRPIPKVRRWRVPRVVKVDLLERRVWEQARVKKVFDAQGQWLRSDTLRARLSFMIYSPELDILLLSNVELHGCMSFLFRAGFGSSCIYS